MLQSTIDYVLTDLKTAPRVYSARETCQQRRLLLPCKSLDKATQQELLGTAKQNGFTLIE